MQELILNAVLKLQGLIIDDEAMSGLLNETRANIDQHRSMLRDLHYLQVYVALCLSLLTHILHSCILLSAEYDVQSKMYSTALYHHRRSGLPCLYVYVGFPLQAFLSTTLLQFLQCL